MGRCVRIRGSSSPKPPPPPPAAEAASCLTLRSGRRVPPVVCSPRTTSGRPPRRHRGSSALRWCGAEAVDKQQRACGSRTRRRGSAADVGSLARGRVRVLGAQQQLCDDDGRPVEEEVPSARAPDNTRGDSFEGPKTTPLMTDDCDAAAVKLKTPTTTPPPPTEAEIEAFFAAAELAERRRFAEAYNYDVALDRPLEGRFEWSPVST